MQVRKSERNVFAQYGPDKLPAFLQIVRRPPHPESNPWPPHGSFFIVLMTGPPRAVIQTVFGVRPYFGLHLTKSRSRMRADTAPRLCGPSVGRARLGMTLEPLGRAHLGMTLEPSQVEASSSSLLSLQVYRS